MDVQWLKTSGGAKWKRPGAGSFWAETKGDENLFVLSLNVPGSEKPGMKRASKMSFQLKTSSKALKIKAAKMLFGPHDNVTVAILARPVLWTCRLSGVSLVGWFFRVGGMLGY